MLGVILSYGGKSSTCEARAAASRNHQTPTLLQALSELATTLSRQISWHSFDELTSVQHRSRLRAVLQLQLFTVHHQRDPQLEIFRRNFLPLQVGCALTETDIGILRDDQNGQQTIVIIANLQLLTRSLVVRTLIMLGLCITGAYLLCRNRLR